MKTILTLLFLVFTTFSSFSQIIVVEMTKWCDYEHSQTMTLHNAFEMDSVLTTDCWKGNIKLMFNLNSNKIVIFDTFDKMSVYNIVNQHQTKSVLNVDAEKDGKYYNFVLGENISDKISLIIQNFEKQKEKSIGTFSNEVSYVIK
jgi:hypothetical protein